MTTIKKLLILSSGGDAPGMNATIRSALRTAIHYGIEVYGAEMGYCGLYNKIIHPLSVDSVANCIQRGGTILKTGRCEAFKNTEVRRECIEYLHSQDIDSIIVLGGNGSFAGAARIAEEDNIAIIGIPSTIDNDIAGTEYTIGFDTARNTALQAIDKIRDTALSLENNFIIEVMGRSSGFIAVDVGIAGGAEYILIPEFPLSAEELVEKLNQKKRSKLASIIVAAESNNPGHTIALAEEIKRLSGIKYKVCILGHTQRGGAPTVFDRKMGSLMGAKAVEALLEGETKGMVAWQKNQIVLTHFRKDADATRYFTDAKLLLLNEIICDA